MDSGESRTMKARREGETKCFITDTIISETRQRYSLQSEGRTQAG